MVEALCEFLLVILAAVVLLVILSKEVSSIFDSKVQLKLGDGIGDSAIVSMDLILKFKSKLLEAPECSVMTIVGLVEV